ncbi:MAG: hypothetical protein GX100_11045 [candidate division WS1 bacterium]|nr:hypothetical protein [candidate division WS1 bacterium]
MNRHSGARAMVWAAGLLVFATAGVSAAGGPFIFWYSDPVQPGEIVMLQGANFGESPTVEFVRIADGKAGDPQAPPDHPGQPTASVVPMLGSATSLKAVVPAGLAPGIIACRVAAGEARSPWVYLNAPQPWWQQGDFGAEASPGGWLRIFGRCLSFADKATVVLRLAGKPDVTLAPVKQECWSLNLELPKTLAEGEYHVWVHNGYGGPAGWREVGTVKIAAHAPFWKTDRFSVVDYGAIPDDDRDDTLAMRQALAAAAANGGGIVYLPRGRFNVDGSFDIPQHTLIQGAGAEKSVLEWPDMPEPPEYVLKGVDNFSLQDLAMFVQNHQWGIISDEQGQGNIWLHRLHIVMERTLATWSEQEFNARRFYRGSDAQWTVRLDGDNVQLTDCEITTDSPPVHIGGSNVVVARNRFFNTPSAGWNPGGGRNSIWEDNQLWGICSGAGGQNIYFARNVARHTYQGFRELMTSDTGGGSYLGKVAATEGTSLTLAEKGRLMTGRNMVVIMEGTGMGQYRYILDRDEQHLTIDRPWDVPPDETSIVAITSVVWHSILTGNDMSDGSTALSLYGAHYDCVLAGNTAARTTGFVSRGMHYGGPAPCFNIQWLNNRITEGYNIRGQEGGAGNGMLLLISGGTTFLPWAHTYDYKGPLQRGVIVRGNVMEANASIGVQGPVADVVIEGNTVCESARGIFGVAGGQGVVLRNNRFEAVEQPLSTLGAAVIHPAERARMGLDTAAYLLPGDPPQAWEKVRTDLQALEQEPLNAPELAARVQACVSAAAKALPAEVYPAALATNLLGISFAWATHGANNVLDSGAGGKGGVSVNVSLPASTPPMQVTAQLGPMDPWEIAGAGVLNVKSGGSVSTNFTLGIPAGAWGAYQVPVSYTLQGPDWKLQASDRVPLGSGRVREWHVVEPFPNQSGLAIDTIVHPPEQRMDLTATYDSPAGPLSWKPVSSKEGTLSLQELLGNGKMQVGYGVCVLRAAQAVPVELTVGGPSGVSVYVNNRLLIQSTRRWRTRAVTLQPGDNVIVCIACSTASAWSLSLNVQPLEPLMPGVLSQVPAAEMPAIRALRSSAADLPEGKGLPFAEGQDWKLIYTNSFDWPRVGSEWEQINGAWVTNDGAIVPQGSFTSLAYRPPVLLPVRFEYDVTVTPVNERWLIGTVLTPQKRVTPRRLWSPWEGFGYFLSLGWHNRLVDEVVRETTEVQVRDPAFPLGDEQPHHVIAQFVPPRAALIVDGKTVLEYKDEAWLPELNTLSLYTWGKARFDNVRIYTAATP